MIKLFFILLSFNLNAHYDLWLQNTSTVNYNVCYLIEFNDDTLENFPNLSASKVALEEVSCDSPKNVEHVCFFSESETSQDYQETSFYCYFRVVCRGNDTIASCMASAISYTPNPEGLIEFFPKKGETGYKFFSKQ
jgi:hypothetical protein